MSLVHIYTKTLAATACLQCKEIPNRMQNRKVRIGHYSLFRLSSCQNNQSYPQKRPQSYCFFQKYANSRKLFL